MELLAPDGIRVADDDARSFVLRHAARPSNELDAVEPRSDGVLLLVGHLAHAPSDFPNGFVGKMGKYLHNTSAMKSTWGRESPRRDVDLGIH